MAVGCVHGRAMPLCGVGATGRVHAMNFGTWMIMNDTADASTHLAMKRRHGDRRRLLARDSNHGKGRPAPGFEPRGLPTRAAVSTAVSRRVNRRGGSRAPSGELPPQPTTARPCHRAARHGAPRARSTAQNAMAPSGREKHNHHPRQQQPPTDHQPPPTNRPPAPTATTTRKRTNYRKKLKRETTTRLRRGATGERRARSHELHLFVTSLVCGRGGVHERTDWHGVRRTSIEPSQ